MLPLVGKRAADPTALVARRQLGHDAGTGGELQWYAPTKRQPGQGLITALEPGDKRQLRRLDAAEGDTAPRHLRKTLEHRNGARRDGRRFFSAK